MEASRFIYDLDLEQIQATLTSWGEPAYRSRQLWQALYHNLVAHPEEIPNLPRALRTRLAEEFEFSHLEAIQELRSSDGETLKTLFRLPDGQAIEAVVMRYEKRRTLCISTQSGCAMGCVFCATGQMGFRRNLSSGEIVEQVVYYARQLGKPGEGQESPGKGSAPRRAPPSYSLTNIVLMGMGEPFHNYDQTMAGIDRMNHPEGLNLGARRFTVSTVGLTPMIRRFANERRQVNLAVSLHAADDETRAKLLPINRKYPIEQVIEACREYVQKTRRRITFEWALIQGVNDTPEQAQRLANRLRGLLCHVNVIPLNPTQGYSGVATTKLRARAFQAELERLGIPCTIRLRRGIDIQAGCGQLAIERSK